MKKLSWLTTTLLFSFVMIHQVEAKVYGYSRSDCKKHHKEWRNGKCRSKSLKKIKAAPVTAMKDQSLTNTIDTSTSTLTNMLPSGMSVVFYSQKNGTVVPSTLQNSFLDSNAKVQVPAGAMYVVVGPDSDDFDNNKTASLNLDANMQYMIGADENNNLAIGLPA